MCKDNKITNTAYPKITGGPRLAVFQILLYLFIVTLPLILAAIFRPQTGHGFFHELGNSFALVGASILALQFILAARIPWVERNFGLDLLLNYHKAMAVFGLLLIVLHPLLFVAESHSWALLLRKTPWPITLGKLALLLLIILALTSIFRQQLRLKYERWRKLHNMAIVIFIFVFIHSWIVGGDLQSKPLQALWLLFLIGVIAAYTHKKVVAPKRAKHDAYSVTSVTLERPGVWTLRMTPPAGEKRFDFLPGQFQFLTLHRADKSLPVEEHPFTIASSPTVDYIESSIKESGDFTSTIGLTKPGDRAAISAPYGRFSYLFHPEQKNLVFIAGGIGITPFISMLRYMHDTSADYNVILIYGNKDAASIVFKDELDSIAAAPHPKLRVIHTLDSPPAGWTEEVGFIDREKLQRLVGAGLTDNAYYICGPKIMNENITKLLKDLGVPDDHIFYEHFGL